MAKTKNQFLCNSCGSVHPKWMGKCPDCGTWDGLQEYKAPTPDARAASRLSAGSNQTGDLTQGGQALTLAEIVMTGKRRLLVCDEPFKNVNGHENRERLAELLPILCGELDFQIVMATGLDWLKCGTIVPIGK